jgi:acyl-CoA synthetase (NDP forming)
MSLKTLMAPTSIGIVGVTDRPDSFGMYAASNALRGGNTDRIYFIHPRRKSLFGKECFHSLSDLPETVGCVAICTPADSVNGILKEAGELGISTAIVFASGFSEEGTRKGTRLEEELIETAKIYGITMLGPNCTGIYNGRYGTFLWGMPLPEQMGTRGGKVGIVAQSGAVVGTTLHAGYVNIGCAISSGNGNLVTLEECTEYLIDDEDVSVVSVYVEGIRDAETFTRALAKAAGKRKPVVILKGGRSERGAASVTSHTGSIAGSQRVCESVFRKFGALLVDDFEQFLCASHMLSILDGHYPEKPQFGAITLSGGENVICADLADRYGVELPGLSVETQDRMREYLPGFATPKNPLDATTDLYGNPKKISGLIKAFEQEESVGGVILGAFIGLEARPIWKTFCESTAGTRREGCGKPVFVVPAREGTRNGELRGILEEAGIPLLSAIQTSMKCLGELSLFLQNKAQKRTLEVLCAQAKRKSGCILSEFESKNILRSIGVPVPSQKLVTNRTGLTEALKDMRFPLVFKINSPDIPHKSDAGGVKLGVKDETEAASAWDEIILDVSKHVPGARFDGILVQEMALEGIEMIMGVVNDVQFGTMFLVGTGGRFVEVFEDVALYPLPLSPPEASEMLRTLKSYRLLTGYRGMPAYDLDSLIEVMVRVADYGWKHKDRIREIEINPIILYPRGKGVCAVDALVVEYADDKTHSSTSSV